MRHALAKRSAVVGAVGLALIGAGCGASSGGGSPPSAARLPEGGEPRKLDPADFTTRIDNPYWPMRPGARWVYREKDVEGPDQRVVVTVTNRTKRIANGIQARVIHDRVTQGGQVIEDTFDWYAQDRDGNVWYLGEDTKEFENGKVKTTAGSWEAGVDGAQPGIAIPAAPRDGMRYRQEHDVDAQDRAEVLSTAEQAEVPFGHFTGVVLTKDTTPLHPRILEYKLYARGVGPVLVLGVSDGAKREELVDYRPGR